MLVYQGVHLISPSEMRSGTEYVITIKVLDGTGKPVSGAKIEIRKTGGILDTRGRASGQTDAQGVAKLELAFSLTNFSLSNKLDRALHVASTEHAVVLALLIGILAYAMYTGPFKWTRAEKF